jgi:hypothetical protein
MNRKTVIKLTAQLGLLVITFASRAQFGGQTSFDFLNVPTHARVAGLGGVNVSHADKDINFLFNNPALTGDSLAGWISASYLFYVADIGQASFAYSHPFKSVGTVSFGIQHMDYGTIEGYDPSGAATGSFRAGETALVISKSHQISAFRLGVTIKPVFSNLAGLRASALMMDLGGIYKHPTQDFTAGLVFRNLGFVLSDYSQSSQTKLPFDVQTGITFKPRHMPVRFSLTVYNLTRAGDVYDDPDEEGSADTLDKVLSHFNFGTEILIHRNINLLLGYNYLRQKELRLDSGGGGTGLTFGLLANIKSFQLIVSNSRYSTGNSNYTFTLASNLDYLILRKRTL